MSTPLAELTTLRLGGPPRRLVEVRSEEEVVQAVTDADAAGEPVLVLGGGSNVVVADEGFAGTVLRLGTAGVTAREVDGRRLLTVQAGEPWEPLVERSVEAGLAGFECLSGIPGSTGATPIQNVGAYGQEVAETIASVRVLDRASGAVQALSPAECGFAYRTSVFKRTPGRWVVLSVDFALAESGMSQPIRYPELARTLGVAIGERAPLGEVRAAVLAVRRAKGMVIDQHDPDTYSAGSFFTNPVLEQQDFERLEHRAAAELGPEVKPPGFPQPDGRVKTSAAWLIERAGFTRGHGDPGGAAVSSKHVLALTNRGRATTRDLVVLAQEVAGGVAERFGVALAPEPVFVGHEWTPPELPQVAALVPARREPE